MIEVATLGSCRRLYELSGWTETYFNYAREWDKPDNHPDRKLLVSEFLLIESNEYRGQKLGTKIERIPAYDLAYLLDKIPGYLDLRHTTVRGKLEWRMYHSEKAITYADTPTEAAALLAIALFENGVLKHD